MTSAHGRSGRVRHRRATWACAVGAAALALAVHASAAGAQSVEITPFAGYRVGNGLFELATGQPLDDDGSPSWGVLVDFRAGRLPEGLRLEALVSHQEARFDVRVDPLEPPARQRVTVDHVQAGSIQEFGRGRVRPFLTGLVGLTRYAAPGDAEVRFSLGTGGGVKLLAGPNFGVRLDGRAYVTFVDVDVAGVCGGLGCALGFETWAVWQADFTVGLIFAF